MTDIWTVVLQFVHDDDLPILIDIFPSLTRMEAKNRVCITNGCMHTHKNYEFIHSKKNRDWSMTNLEMNMCASCLSWGLWQYFLYNERVPNLRCEGTLTKRMVVQFNNNVENQMVWLLNKTRLDIQNIIPQKFECSYYEKHEELVKQLSTINNNMKNTHSNIC